MTEVLETADVRNLCFLDVYMEKVSVSCPSIIHKP